MTCKWFFFFFFFFAFFFSFLFAFFFFFFFFYPTFPHLLSEGSTRDQCFRILYARSALVKCEQDRVARNGMADTLECNET